MVGKRRVPERVTAGPGTMKRRSCCKAPERVMMQCGARVDDERQVRSGVGNERDKAVYSGGGGGEERKPIVQGALCRPEQSLSFRRTRRLCAKASHTREGAG